MSCGTCTSCVLEQQLQDVREDLDIARRTNEAYAVELLRLRDEAAAAVIEAQRWRQVAGELVLHAALSSMNGDV